MIDARDPATPERIATLLNPAGSSAEDIVVYTAPYGPYAGRDIAVAGIQGCSGSRFDTDAERGLMLWDVTSPAAPVQLGYLRTACCTRGVHEFEVQHRTDLAEPSRTPACPRAATRRRPARAGTETSTATATSV